MADTKITGLQPPQPGYAIVPSTDVLPIVVIADPGMAASGSTRKATVNQILGAGGTATLASATITGDLTVDTSTLKVDSANDIVLIGSATKATYGANKLEVRGASISDANLGATTTGNLAIFTTDSQAIDTGGVLSLGGGFNGTTPYMFAGIAGRKETATNAIAQGYLQFFTTNVSNGIIERYRIAGDGVHTWRNVGGVAGTAMTLNSTGLGVGGSPSAKLDVNSASITDTDLKYNLIVRSSDSYTTSPKSGIAFASFFNGSSNLPLCGIFGGKENGTINDFASAVYIATRSNGGNITTRLTVDSSGNVGVANGNVILGTSGKGIDFSATASGSGTMTSELLNDYEEGTWTIGLTFGGGSTGLTTALNTGRYTKVGRQVTVCGRLELSNKGSSTGAAAITGLPFSIASGNDSQQAASFRFNGVSYTGAFQGYGALSSTSINLEQISEAGSPTDITDSNFSNGTSIQISFTYTI